MKNVLKSLEEQQTEVRKEFDLGEQERQGLVKNINELNTRLNQVVSRLTQLQGKFQALDEAKEAFKDEPKEK